MPWLAQLLANPGNLVEIPLYFYLPRDWLAQLLAIKIEPNHFYYPKSQAVYAKYVDRRHS